MLELGAEDLWWHRETGSYAVGRADVLVCVGPRARAIGEGASASGFPAEKIQWVESPERAAGVLEAMLGAGDTVLFKASRGVGLDRAVALLMKTVR
jgi:UDP-N-acetylmuramyl pentapeptide synthase